MLSFNLRNAPRSLSRICRNLRLHRGYHTSLRVSDEVRNAIHRKTPVVALETTIYTHGFPYPENVKLAQDLEAIVRQNGAIPATIGIVDAEAVVGLTSGQINRLIEAAYHKNALKVSRRDLAFACGSSILPKKLNGGTTVSGTMALAHLAGIDILATGGIGGVHRDAEISMDISADLIELGRTPVAVVSSGCKSFLDIPRTLEYLETHGVAVGTFRDGSDAGVEFPAFWSRESGILSPSVIEDEKHAAAMIYAQRSLSTSSGLLFANPIPAASSIPKKTLDAIIKQAIDDAEKKGFVGKRNTPYVLARIAELTQGDSVIANRVLIRANVRKGAKIASELAALKKCTRKTAMGVKSRIKADDRPDSAGMRPADSDTMTFNTPKPKSNYHNAIAEGNCNIIVAGSVALDYDCRYIMSSTEKQASVELHTSNPSKIHQSIGGVGYNVARAARSSGSSVRLLSAIGADPAGHVLLDHLRRCKLDLEDVRVVSEANTSLYIAFNDANKGLLMAASDMRLFEDEKNAPNAEIWKSESNILKPSWFVVDANWNAASISKLLKEAKAVGVKTAFEPVSIPKASRIFGKTFDLPVFPDQQVDLISPNRDELFAIYQAAQSGGMFEREDWWQLVSSFGLSSFGMRDDLVKHSSQALVDAGIPQQCLHLLPFFPEIVVSLGSDGLLLTILLNADDDRLKSTNEAARWVLGGAPSKISSSGNKIGGIYMRRFEAAEVVASDDIMSVNGVGDTLLGTLVANMAQSQGGAEEYVQISQQAAIEKLKGR